MSQAVSESRFAMWRTVFALVHADHVVTPDEKELAESYMENVTFSDEQKAILHEDLLDPQNIGEMFGRITEPVDQGEFFQFARIMAWCDGDLAQQEDMIISKLKDTQMGKMDEESLRSMVRESREVFNVERLKQEEAFEEEAKDLISLGRPLDVLKTNPEVRGV